MTDTSARVTWGLVGLVAGFLLAGVFRAPLPHFGIPQSMFFIPLFVVLLWIVLLLFAVKWLFIGGDKRPGRLADLPADFDDWHRRAHAQMEREAGARAGGTQATS